MRIGYHEEKHNGTKVQYNTRTQDSKKRFSLSGANHV